MHSSLHSCNAVDCWIGLSNLRTDKPQKKKQQSLRRLEKLVYLPAKYSSDTEATRTKDKGMGSNRQEHRQYPKALKGGRKIGK